MFSDPVAARQYILANWLDISRPLKSKGAHLYAHLTAVCPVACLHCMYASGPRPKAAKIRLNSNDIERLIQFAADSGSQKFTISGGGEPFVEFSNLLKLIERVAVDEIEIDTSGNWATSSIRTREFVGSLLKAKHLNPSLSRLLVRVSSDQFHSTAKNPVAISNYAEIVKAWREGGGDFDLAFRGLDLEGDNTALRIADSVNGRLVNVNRWNKSLVIENGVSIPYTFNVLRFSGAGESLHDQYSTMTKSVVEYFSDFERQYGGLRLAGSLNQAVDGNYTLIDGISFTIDFDGRIFIYGGSAPDLAPKLGEHSFEEAVACFNRDPITHVLSRYGIYWLTESIKSVAPTAVINAFRSNGVISILDILLVDDVIRLLATLLSCKKMVEEGDAICRSPQIASLLNRITLADLTSAIQT